MSVFMIDLKWLVSHIHEGQIAHVELFVSHDSNIVRAMTSQTRGRVVIRMDVQISHVSAYFVFWMCVFIVVSVSKQFVSICVFIVVSVSKQLFRICVFIVVCVSKQLLRICVFIVVSVSKQLFQTIVKDSFANYFLLLLLF